MKWFCKTFNKLSNKKFSILKSQKLLYKAWGGFSITPISIFFKNKSLFSQKLVYSIFFLVWASMTCSHCCHWASHIHIQVLILELNQNFMVFIYCYIFYVTFLNVLNEMKLFLQWKDKWIHVPSPCKPLPAVNGCFWSSLDIIFFLPVPSQGTQWLLLCYFGGLWIVLLMFLSDGI